jgi:hypothetical protein
MEGNRNVYNTPTGKSEGRRPLERLWLGLEDDIKTGSKEKG